MPRLDGDNRGYDRTNAVLGPQILSLAITAVMCAGAACAGEGALAAAWKADTGKSVSIAYASSAALAKQIERGAPADIFVSADLQWMDYLEKAKLIRARTRKNLFGNKLVLIEPSDADVKLEIAKASISRAPRETAKSPFVPSTRVLAEYTPRKLSNRLGSLRASRQSSRKWIMSAVR